GKPQVGRCRAGAVQGFSHPRAFRADGAAYVGQIGWFCGDYILDAALEVFPSYDHYWMIEYDVRLDFRQNLGFFDRLPASDADLLAFQVWKALTLWFWYAPFQSTT